MTVVSTTKRLVTKKKRVFVTDLEVDELVEFWRAKYELIFANEAKSRRLWGSTARANKKPPPASADIEAEIERRQIEWDAYVKERLADIQTATVK